MISSFVRLLALADPTAAVLPYSDFNIHAGDGALDEEDFMAKAAAFVNDCLFGTLSCGVALHPSTAKQHAQAVHELVSSLKYGCITVNNNPIVGYSVVNIPWGAWNAAGTPENIGSGNVLAHSTMYDHAEKGVGWFPFVVRPRPLWHPGNTNQEAIQRLYFAYLRRSSLFTLGPLLAAAFGSK
jgi:hypothetical protein